MVRAPKTIFQSVTGTGGRSGPTNNLEIVQGAVMREADYYAGTVAQATSDFRAQNGTVEARDAAQKWKLNQATAAYINATGENPMVAVVDMVVLATLSRHVVEDYWVGVKFGEAARPLLDTHIQLQSNAWRFAQTVLSPSQVDALVQILQEYRLNHPNARSVRAFRLPELVEKVGTSSWAPRTRASANLLTILSIDPLAGLDPTTQAIQQTRVLAQRAMYYAQRAPQLLSWQVELLAFQLAGQPETRELLADVNDVAGSTKTFARTAEGLPKLVNEQREAAINQIFAGIASERTNLIAELSSQEAKLNTLLPQVRETLIAGGDMARSLDATVKSLDAFVRYVSPPETNTVSPAADTNSQPFNVLDYGTAATKVGAMAKELNALLASVDQSLPQFIKAGQQAAADAKGVVNHAFKLGVVLILVLGIVTIFVVQVCRRWGRAETGEGRGAIAPGDQREIR